jgi:hypothetical protein
MDPSLDSINASRSGIDGAPAETIRCELGPDTPPVRGFQAAGSALTRSTMREVSVVSFKGA